MVFIFLETPLSNDFSDLLSGMVVVMVVGIRGGLEDVGGAGLVGEQRTHVITNNTRPDERCRDGSM